MKTRRGKYHGVLQIVRFNWPMYLTAACVLTAGGVIAFIAPLPNMLRIFVLCAIGLAGFWLILSLAVSHYVYDRSEIYEGEWIAKALKRTPSRYVSLHAGLDEFSDVLVGMYPTSQASVVDFFDPEEMTEPSIERARGEQMNSNTTRADFRALPFKENEFDAAFVIFAAHELRQPESRVQFLREVQRIVKAEGQILLVEHLRDLPNFVAFGPGCFHFHSHATWINAFAAANLAVEKEFRLTPFVRAFLLES